MVVNHLSTSVVGGAAIAARRLHHGLRSIGVESRFWHLRRNSEVAQDPTYQVMQWADATESVWQRWGSQVKAASEKPRRKRELRRALAGRPNGLELFTSPHRSQATACPPSYLEGDILHLHWISNLIDYPTFFGHLPAEYPLVWSLHDMNPLTGGCHYSHGCDRFKTVCQHCPQLGSPDANDMSRRFFQAKQQAVGGKNLHVVANSHWMEQQARRSGITRAAHSFRTIHYCLDTENFRPHAKADARHRLGLPADRPIVAFGAESCENLRKGFAQLLLALPLVHAALPFDAVTFGNPAHMPSDQSGLPPIKMLGYVHDEQRLAQIYSAADLFVVPSLEEALGQTGIEAMSCGTPVVAFDVGGLSDYVQPLKTGLLAERSDPYDLARHMIWLLQRPALAQGMGRRARRLIERQFGMLTQAAKYRQLYEQLIDKRPSHPKMAVASR